MGNFREELLFVLRQEYESYQAFQRKIGDCDEQLYKHYQTMPDKGGFQTTAALPAGETTARKRAAVF
jgi:hypothetical protein